MKLSTTQMLLIAGAAWWWFKGRQDPNSIAQPLLPGAEGPLPDFRMQGVSGFPAGSTHLSRPQATASAVRPQGVTTMRQPQAGGGVLNSPQGETMFQRAPQARMNTGTPQAGQGLEKTLGYGAGLSG